MELESVPAKDVAADSAFERVFERLYGKMSEEKLRLIWLAGHAVFYYWRLLVVRSSKIRSAPRSVATSTSRRPRGYPWW